MGVDYEAVGGVGIAITEDMIQYAIKQGVITQDEWEGCSWYDCVENISKKYTTLDFQEGGDSAYSGNTPDIYVVINGCGTLGEANLGASKFCEHLEAVFGVVKKPEDLQIILDYIVW